MNSITLEYLLRTVKSPDVRKCFLWTVIFSFMLMVWAFFKDCLGNYIAMMIPALIVNMIIIFYGFSQAAGKVCIYGLCILNLCAALTQAVLDTGSMTTYIHMAIGLAFAYVTGIVYTKMRHRMGLTIFLSAILTLGALALCLVLPETNGAKAWIVIGPLSLQITEFVKFFYVIFIGSLFSVKNREWLKLIYSFAVTGLAALLFLVINEFGTLLVIGSAFVCVSMISFRKKAACRIIVMACVIAVVGLLFVAYNGANSRIGKWSCPECQTENHQSAECRKCDIKKPVGGYNFVCPICQYTTWGEEEIKSEPANCEKCKEDGFLQSFVGRLCKKIYDRSSVTYNYEYVKGSGSAYHMEQNQKSMKVGKLFGDKDSIVYVPNVDTDSVVAGLMNRLGMVFIFILLISFFSVFVSIYSAHSAIRMMALFVFVFQALYTFCGTLNILPMTGIGLPLISRGGSNLMISCGMIYFMLTGRRDNEEGAE